MMTLAPSHLLLLLLLALIVSAVSAAYPVPTSWPDFGWGTVGSLTFAHLAKRTDPLNVSEAAFLGRFQMVTIEKPMDAAHVGWTEDKMSTAARAVKAAAPRAKLLRYINALLDFNHSDANFSLHVPAAARGFLLPPFHNGLGTFNLGLPGMRALLVQECLNATSIMHGPFDGCFIDRANFGQQLSRADTVPKGFTEQDVAGLARGGELLLTELQQAVGSGRYILAKEHGDLAGYGDGTRVNSLMMNDGLCSVYQAVKKTTPGLWYDAEACLAQLNASLAAAQRGQLVQSRAMGPIGTSGAAHGNFTFVLAAFLSFAEEHSYFSYASNGRDSYDFAATPWMPQYDLPLSAPLGPATRTGPNGSVFTRRFAAGVNVSFSAYTGEASICWGGSRGCDRAVRPMVALRGRLAEK